MRLKDKIYKEIINVDARIKILWLFSAAMVFLTDNIIMLGVIFIGTMFLFTFSKVHKTIYMKGFLYSLIFFVILFLLFLFNSSEQDIANASISILKWSVIVLATLSFFVMTRPFDLIYSLRGLKVPESITFALGIGFRFIPIIFEEGNRVLIAQRARGLDIKKGFTRIFSFPKIIFSISIPLIMGMLFRLHEMWIAMAVRGFEAGKNQKVLFFNWNWSNIILLLYSVSIIVLVVWLRR